MQEYKSKYIYNIIYKQYYILNNVLYIYDINKNEYIFFLKKSYVLYTI